MIDENAMQGGAMNELLATAHDNECCMQRILDSLAMTTRWWKQLDYVEIEWTAGPIDIADGIGKELVLQYRTNLSTGSTFYTDANGREMQKRVLNYRPTWDLKVTDPVSGNYYPLTAAIAVKVGLRFYPCMSPVG